MDIKFLETELMKLSTREKAMIISKLLESLDIAEDENLENVWVEEAVKRYNQVLNGENILIDSDLIIKEAKSKYN